MINYDQRTLRLGFAAGNADIARKIQLRSKSVSSNIDRGTTTYDLLNGAFMSYRNLSAPFMPSRTA